MAGVAALGLSVVTLAAGCRSADDLATVRTEARENSAIRTIAAGAPLAQDASVPTGPVLVTCEPNQRTLVRQTIVNNQPVAQVECITTSAAYPNPGYPGAVYSPPYPAPAAYDDVRVVPAATTYRAPAPRRVVTSRRTVVERPAGRSWKKSAIIIGSSAGIGAGVGAAVGGKKGALIGAAIGGGGAAIWDQATRRR
jgi:hypothetical protein